MSKKIVVVSGLMVLLVLPLTGLAIDLNVAQPPTADAINLGQLLNAFLNVIWWIFLAVAVILLIITGVLFLNTQGDPEKIKKARMSLILAIVGIVVALLGYRMFNTVHCLIDPSACVLACVPAGGACTANADCCSNDCAGSICL